MDTPPAAQSPPPADIRPPEPRAVLANDFENVSAVLFSPDGSRLAVNDDRQLSMGCFGYSEATIHVYDTQTWKERLIVQPGRALVGWAFAPGGDKLVVATRENVALGGKHPVEGSEIDLRSGESKTVSFDFESAAVGALTTAAVDPKNQFKAQGDKTEVRVTAVATGKPIARLGPPQGARIQALVLDAGQTVLFVAVWPTGEIAAWNLVNGAAAPLLTVPRSAVSAFSMDADGHLAVAEKAGEVWLYEWSAGSLQGRIVSKVPGATAVALDPGATRVFVGAAKGGLVGLETEKGRRVFRAATPKETPAALFLDGDRLQVETEQGNTWAFQVPSGRLLERQQGLSLLAGGDPAAPAEPWGDAEEPPVRTTAICFDRQCWIAIGDSVVRVLAGEQPGTATASAGELVEGLGQEVAAQGSFLCLRGATVVAFSECEPRTQVKGLVGATQKQALLARQSHMNRALTHAVEDESAH
jgi:dipeptidyl aminopeptidase/acylaminoacyl peptidase